ncbi:DUF4493 domain-containing protein [Bacteroides sp.]|uniref:DUF4493 domain-containing protein n=1 Tax=Bacteroides sp. TaxID=29523 RepID=UPI0026397F3C|nr:DUF4493 domain-containing protein [Bacteroides sp.]MDD3038352.1 DUF4493 domain-containing protein [Bacteroides sp.]
MKQTNIIILTLLVIMFFASCNSEEQSPTDNTTGYFTISGLSLSSNEEVFPLTRSVNASLQLQISQGEIIVKDYAPGDDLSKRIVLPVGDYTLKAFTPDQTEAIDNESGIPVYALTSSFEVKEGDITSISLVVPQINVGVNVDVSESFSASFHSVSVAITSISGRSVTISDLSGSSDFYYFKVPANGKLQYVFTAYNADEEQMTLTKEITDIDVARNYSIRLDLAD